MAKKGTSYECKMCGNVLKVTKEGEGDHLSCCEKKMTKKRK